MSQSSTAEISQDLAYDLLSSSRRRFVISTLRSENGSMELNELSERLAAWENDTPVEDLTDQQIKRIYVSLYQTHIPKLSEAGVVSYDQDTGQISLEHTVQHLNLYIPSEGRSTVPWLHLYLGLAVVGLVFFTGSILVGDPVLGIDTTMVGVAILITYGVLSAAQYMSARSP